MYVDIILIANRLLIFCIKKKKVFKKRKI